jgi:hypothetical protein
MRWSSLFQNIYSFWINNWILESYQRRFRSYYLDFDKLWFRVQLSVLMDKWVLHSALTLSYHTHTRYTLKKRYFTEPRKKVSEIWKSVQMLKKRFFRSTKPLKVLTLSTNSETSNTKPFLSFVEKCETFRVLYQTLLVLYQSLMVWYETMRV